MTDDDQNTVLAVVLSEDVAAQIALDPMTQVREGECPTWTTAPKDYDWFGTREICDAGRASNGKLIRMVVGPLNRVEQQRDRYASGLHMAVDVTEWRKLVSYGLVKGTP